MPGSYYRGCRDSGRLSCGDNPLFAVCGGETLGGATRTPDFESHTLIGLHGHDRNMPGLLVRRNRSDCDRRDE